MLGRIITVDEVALGGQLIEPVAASTVLTLDSVADFDDRGGLLAINGTTHTYVAADPDDQTLMLAAPTSYPAGLMVTLLPARTEMIARVQLDGRDPLMGTVEALPALVPYSMRGQLPQGVRLADSGESVRVVQVGSRLEIADVLYAQPDLITTGDIQDIIDAVGSMQERGASVLATATGRPPALTSDVGTGTIGWPALTVSYFGDAETIAAGSTTKRYVSWSPGDSTLTFSDVLPSADSVVVFVNHMGLPTDVQNSSFVDGALVVNGTLTALALETDLVLTTRLIGGNPIGTRAELNPTGLELWQAGPDGVTKAGSFSSGGSDFLQVSGSDGSVLAAIDSTGKITSASAALGTAAGDTYLNGKLFEEYLDPLPRGTIAYGARKSNGTAALGGTNIKKWLEVQTVLEPNRLYRVTLTPTYTVSAGAGARCVLALFYAAGGTPVVTTAGQLNSTRHAMPLAGEAFTSALLSYTFDTTPLTVRTEYRFLTAYYGEGTAAYPIANGALPSILTVDDVGPAQPDIGIDHSAPPPSGGTKQTYQTFWQASDSGAYRGGGARRSPSDADYDLIHGTDPSGFNGNCSSIAIFGAGAYYSTNPSEVGKSVTTALTGADVVAADVLFKCSHAYDGSGMTVYYNTESRTSMPGTYTNSAYYGSSYFAIGQAKYVPVQKTIRTSLTLGSPPAGYQYYGRINSHTQGRPPVIRYTYTR